MQNIYAGNYQHHFPWPSSNLAQEAALANGPYCAALSYLSNITSSIPLKMKTLDGGEVLEHPILDLLNRPNKYTTKSEFWQNLANQFFHHGEAFIQIIRSEGRLISLGVIPTANVEVRFNNNYPAFFNAKGKKIPSNSLIYLREPTINPGRVIPPYIKAAKSITIFNQILESSAKSFSQSTFQKSIITTTDDPSAPMNEEEKHAFMQGLKMQISENQYTILDGEVKIHNIASNTQDPQIASVRSQVISDIAREFGINPHVLGTADPSIKYGGMLETNKALVYKKLKPILNIWAEKLTLALGLEDTHLYFDTEAFLDSDPSEKLTKITKKIMSGLYSINEGRLDLNLPLLEDEAADNHNIAANLAGSSASNEAEPSQAQEDMATDAALQPGNA